MIVELFTNPEFVGSRPVEAENRMSVKRLFCYFWCLDLKMTSPPSERTTFTSSAEFFDKARKFLVYSFVNK